MPSTRKPSIQYAPRGVVRKQIALRLLAPELATHEALAAAEKTSSASFARRIYLRGLASYQRARKGAEPAMGSRRGVNRP
jgi:hypothetical protein